MPIIVPILVPIGLLKSGDRQLRKVQWYVWHTCMKPAFKHLYAQICYTPTLHITRILGKSMPTFWQNLTHGRLWQHWNSRWRVCYQRGYPV